MEPSPIHTRERAGDDTGFTLIEVVVAATLFIIGSLATLALLDNGARATSVSKQRDVASALAQEVVERATGGRYTTVRNDMTDIDAGTPLPGPADRLRQTIGDATSIVGPLTLTAPASPPKAPATQSWSMTRSGTSFTVSYTACTTSDRIDGVEIKGPYDCDPTTPTGLAAGTGTGVIPTTRTAGGCTVATVPVTASSSAAASALGVSVQLLGFTSLSACLDAGKLTSALAPTLCSLAQSTPLTSSVDSLLGAGGLLGGVARVNAGVGCGTLTEPDLVGPAAGAASVTRVTVRVAWADGNGGTPKVDRTSIIRRPTR